VKFSDENVTKVFVAGVALFILIVMAITSFGIELGRHAALQILLKKAVGE
jgi:hypothetical protein